MSNPEHRSPIDHEPNWDDRETFGQYGYQLPYIADIYASGYELDRLTKARGDEYNNNPYDETPQGLYGTLDRFPLGIVHKTAGYFFASLREGHRVFASEFLAAKQRIVLYQLENPDSKSSPGVRERIDPAAEIQAWLAAIEGGDTVAVLQEHWDSLGSLAQDEQARSHVPDRLHVDDFEPLLAAAYARMVEAARNWPQ